MAGEASTPDERINLIVIFGGQSLALLLTLVVRSLTARMYRTSPPQPDVIAEVPHHARARIPAEHVGRR